MHIDELARLAAAGVEAQGAKAVTFGTVTVSDGISMGTPACAIPWCPARSLPTPSRRWWARKGLMA